MMRGGVSWAEHQQVAVPWGRTAVAWVRTPLYMQSLLRAAARQHLPGRAGLLFTTLMSLFSCPWGGSGAESCGLVVMALLTGDAVASAMAEYPE